MNLLEIEKRLTDKRDYLSPDARSVSQQLLSTLRSSDHDRAFTTSKRVLGEICRALQVEASKTKGINQWYISAWNNSDMEVAVMLSSDVSIFETIADAINPMKNKQYLNQ